MSRLARKRVIEVLRPMRGGDLFLSLLFDEPSERDIVMMVNSITWIDEMPIVRISSFWSGITPLNYLADENTLAKRIESGHLIPIATENYTRKE